MKRFILALALAGMCAAQTVNNNTGGGTPSGAAGGSLAGTYPNPSIATSVALPGSPTTTTQSQADNSTKIATTAYVDTGLATKGAGTVTSVGFTGGLISVATATTTPALTVAGTSGGIPYFSAASTWASSGALTQNALVLGGGAGSAPAPMGSLGTTTTLLHGNAAGAPTFGAVVSADLNITTSTCTNQFLTAISATGTGTCTTDTLASAQHANQGTTTTVLHGNGSGNPSFGAVVSADLNITTTTCTNQFLTAISATGTGTCSTVTLAGAQFANQGTTTTVLHGNGAGNPSFGAIVAADITSATITGTQIASSITLAGTPTITGTNITGVPISTGVSGLGTGVATFLATPSGANFNSMIAAGGIPIAQSSKSAAYTTVLADAGTQILHPTADNNARTFTIDSNANVAYAIGTTITFVNQINTLSIAITSDTLQLAGSATTGTRTLAAGGLATAIKVTSTLWFISGSGLT